ncbi:7432_t:CDS:2 [Entrophospora sp. SA101]|nr:7432_t:CDS:2 [Entrophospora sp. SA101]
MLFFKLNDSTSIDDDLLSNVKLDSDIEANGVDEGDINDNNDKGRKEFVIVREVFNVEDRINCNDNNESDDSSDDNYTLTPDSLHDIGTDSTMLTSDWPFPSSTTSSSSSINVDNIFTIEQQASMKIPFTIWEDPEADDT